MTSHRPHPDHSTPVPWPVPAGTTRLVALGDPHGAIGRIRAVCERERDGRSAVVSVGDVVGYASGAASSECVELLQAVGIPSVRGNHEDWVRAGGVMLVAAPGEDRRLRPGVLDVTDRWPWDARLELPGGLDVHVTHSLHASGWEWVTADSVERLLSATAPAVVTCIGHSHRPALYGQGPGGVHWREPFDFRFEEAVERPIQPGWRYVIDCGSLARPEPTPRTRCLDWGTYGVVDAANRTIGLRSVR